MLVGVGIEQEDFSNNKTYNRTSKSNIPKYNIKATKTKDMSPFLSPKHLQNINLSQLSHAKDSSPDSPKKKVESPKKLSKEDEKKAEDEKRLEGERKNIAEASVDSLSEMNINTKHLTARLEHEEALHQLYIERLPGTVKTKWALGHKMNMDLAIIEALN